MSTISVTGTSRWRIRFRAVVRVWGVGGVCLCLVGGSAGLSPALDRAGEQLSGTQGQILVVKVVEADLRADVSGTFLGRAVPFFPDLRPEEPVGYMGLIGLDLQEKPGMHVLLVDVNSQGHTRRVPFRVHVDKGTFPIQHLTLPREKVDLDEASLSRWKAEQQQIREALDNRFFAKALGEQVSRAGAGGSHRGVRQRAGDERSNREILIMGLILRRHSARRCMRAARQSFV